MNANYYVRYIDADGAERRAEFGKRAVGPVDGHGEAWAFMRLCDAQGVKAGFPGWYKG